MEQFISLTLEQVWYLIIIVKQTKSISSHQEGTSTLIGLKNDNYIMTGGYDGIVKIWDLRKYQSIYEVKVRIN